jgi:hypothetical protein
MSKATALRVGIAAIAMALIGAAWTSRLRRGPSTDAREGRNAPATSAAPELVRPPVEAAPAPKGADRSGLASPPDGTELPTWQDAQIIVEALISDEVRRRTFLKAFLQMAARIREIEKARVRVLIERDRTVIEVPAFRDEGRAILAEWSRKSLALLTPEEGARFGEDPPFETGQLSPRLDLLRTAGIFSGSRNGKDLEPEFVCDGTHQIEAQRFGNGKVQVRDAAAEHVSFSQFENQQEALNDITRRFGHLLGSNPQLFR